MLYFKHLILSFLIVSSFIMAQGKLKYGMVIHGGAGSIVKGTLSPDEEKAYRNKLTEALNAGYKVLQE